jgi:hypothetical protein
MTRASTSPARRPLRVGVFGSLEAADAAIVRLLNAGFTREQITVVAPASIKKHFEGFKAELPGGTRTVPAAATGTAVGAVIGGIVAGAALIGTGAAALVVAGPLIAAASGGAAAGGFIGAMLTRGFEDEAAQFYDQSLRLGKILVGVEYTGLDQRERLARAELVLAEAGAEHLPLSKG